MGVTVGIILYKTANIAKMPHSRLQLHVKLQQGIKSQSRSIAVCIPIHSLFLGIPSLGVAMAEAMISTNIPHPAHFNPQRQGVECAELSSLQSS